MTAAREAFEIFVDGCKHYASVENLAAAQDLARWCHARGYCYHVRPPKVGEVYHLRSFTGNQPPRETWTDVVVTEVEPPKPLMHHGRVHYTRLGWGTGSSLNTELFVRRARRPLDPTPPGPPAVGEQPALFDLLEATP